MGRPRKGRLFPVALSPEAAAEALVVSPRQIRAAIASGELEAYSGPNHVTRILVFPSLIEWVRTWPRAEIARKIKRKSLRRSKKGNPWSAENFDPVRQAEVARADPKLAARLAKSAGSFIGAPPPTKRSVPK